MGFTTPRGRQIDWDAEKSFAIMSQITDHAPRFSAIRILRITEAIDNLPQLIGYTSGVATVLLMPNATWEIPFALVGGAVAGTLMLVSECTLWIPGLVFVLRLWNSIPELIRLATPPLAVGFSVGWVAAALWAAGVLVGGVVGMAALAPFMRRRYRATGTVFGQAELCFEQALRYCASASGTNIETGDT